MATIASAADAPQADTGDRFPFKFHCRVNFSCDDDAAMVRNALAVDPELRPDQVSKCLTVEGNALLATFAAADVRTLRAAVGSFCDLLGLATRILEAFKPQPVAAQGTGAGLTAAVPQNL